jgi:phage terminase large subunit-like protein
MLSAGGAHFALFAAEYIVQTKGRWAKRPLYLEPWQLRIESEMLRTDSDYWIELDEDDLETCARDPALFYERLAGEYKRLDPEPGVRLYREAYIQLTKKTGKSTGASAHALYFLCADGEEGAEVYSAASAKDQARIVFNQARETVNASPRLLDFVRVLRDAIVVERTNSVYRVLSADAGVHEGLNPHANIIDELHRHPKRDLYDVLTSGDVAREQPFTLNITNAGVNEDTICGELYQQAVRVIAGDPGARRDLYAYVPELDDKDEEFVLEKLADHVIDKKPLDSRAIELAKQVNEASWIGAETIIRDFERFPVFVFRRRRLNAWTEAEESWLPITAWDACAVPGVEIDPEAEVVITVDMGLKRDTAGRITIARQQIDGRDRYVVKANSWGVRPIDPNKPPPPAHVLIDEKVEFALVENDVRNERRKYRRMLEFGYDPWRFERSAQDFEAEGMVVVEFPQQDSRMCPATEAARNAIVDQVIAHDGDPVLRAHIRSAVAKDTGRGFRLTKKDVTKPVDLAIALVMGVARLEANARVAVPQFIPMA